MFDHSTVTGAQLLRAIPGAAERTLRASPCIASTSRVNVVFHGSQAACKIERSGAAGRVTKKNPNPSTVYTVKGHIVLPSVDAAASLPRIIANEWLAYSLHEVFHGIYTDREAYIPMLRSMSAQYHAAGARYFDYAGLHSIWNAIEDPRIENAAVQHGIARGYAAVARALVLKHWQEPAAAASRAMANAQAAKGNVRAAYTMLPGIVAYYGRLWLPADDRAAMRAEIPACILPHVDAACAALAALSVRSLDEAAHGDAQQRDVEPILRAIVDAMRAAKAAEPAQPEPKAPTQPGDEPGEPGDGEPGEPGDGEPGDGEPGDGEPGDDAGDGEPGEPQDGAQPGANGPQGDDEGAGEPGDAQAGGSNQQGAIDQAPDMTGAALESEPMNLAPTTPIIDAKTLEQVGAENALSDYAQPTATKIGEADPATVDGEMLRARKAVANPGAIAAQLRRLLSKTDTSEHRRGLSHGRLRVQALPRALATGAGAFQRRMDSGSDRCSIVVAVDTSSSMGQRDGTWTKDRENPTRADSAGAFAMLLLDALRGAQGSSAYVFGFGGNSSRDDFGRQTFRPALIKGWQDTYTQAMRRAANLPALPSGGTPIRPALAYAVRELRNAPAGRKILILLTDADFNGQQERPIVQAAERDGVLCIGVGVGSDASQIGNLFPAHHIAVSDVSQLSEKVCRTLADAVLAADNRHG